MLFFLRASCCGLRFAGFGLQILLNLVACVAPTSVGLLGVVSLEFQKPTISTRSWLNLVESVVPTSVVFLGVTSLGVSCC